MESGVKTKRLRIGGMTCASCQNKIERKLRGTAGVERAEVSYSAGTAAVTYDAGIISLRNIVAVIEKLDYRVLAGDERRQSDTGRVVATLAVIVSLYALLQQFGILNLLVPSQLADAKMGYGMLFVIGLVTSVHCIAMCGGINLSQSIPRGGALAEKTARLAAFAPTLLYNLGRVASYTAVGFILGLAGLVLGGGSDAGLPAMLQGILKLIAGAFMAVMGINMLGLFPRLRKLNPGLPKIFGRKAGASAARSKSPLFVGLLNGLMPCGPLQSMQIVALASGNPLAGALSMFLFSLGTAPLMLGLGSAVSALGKKFAQKVMGVGAVLVVVLGLAMLSQGGSLSGFLPPDLLLPIVLALGAIGAVSSLPFRKLSHRTVSTVAALGVAVLALASWNWWGAVADTGGSAAADDGVQIVDGRQIVNSTLSSGRYPNIAVRAGTPVKWVIDAPKGSINGCNNRMLIREYGIEYSFKTGENIIEFTPAKAGNVQYSCWMGMIRGNISVAEAEDSH
jgi:sulfite exporter TauE/SafE/copper chaperone CopZ